MRTIIVKNTAAVLFAIALLLLLACTFSSCSVSKKLDKQKTEVSKDSSVVTATETTITETKTADTTLAADTTKHAAVIVADSSGNSQPLIFEDALVKTITTVNIKTGKVSSVLIAKPRKVNINVSKTTKTKEDKNVRIKSNVVTESKKTAVDKKFKGAGFVWAIIFLVLTLFAIYIIGPRIKNNKNTNT